MENMQCRMVAVQEQNSDKQWHKNRESDSDEPLPERFIFDIVPVTGVQGPDCTISPDEACYIIDGDKYLTNNNVNGSGGTPTFKEVVAPGAAQEWNIIPDAAGSNYYKITSKADGRYINEYGVFGTNQYYSDWNTYLITIQDGLFSIRWTQSAIKNGVKFLVSNGSNLVEQAVAHSDSYTVKIVNVSKSTSIGNVGVDNCAVAYDATAQTVSCRGVQAGATVQVVNAAGAVVAKAVTDAAGTATMSLAGHPQGLYLFVIKSNGGGVAHKFVK